MPLIGGGTILLPGDLVLTDVFDSLIITTVAAVAVPEPDTILLILPGMLLIALRRRKWDKVRCQYPIRC